MKHVWKCDFCSQTGTKEKIEKHEKECIFNPTLKICNSCMYHTYGGSEMFGYNEECEIGKDWFKITDNKIPCKFWDTENIKLKRKLKIDIINS